MVTLLAMFQKMKLIRQINQETLRLTQISGKIDRVAKNIKRNQEKYQSLFAQLDSQAKLMKSNAAMIFQRDSGLGVGSVNPNNYYGNNQFIYLKAQEILKNGYIYQTGNKNDNGSPKTAKYNYDPNLFNKMWSDYNNNGNKFIPLTETDENGNSVYKTTTRGAIITDDTLSDTVASEPVYDYNGYNAYDVEAFNNAIQAAGMQQQQTQFMVQQATSQYDNNISIWLEAEKAKLEYQQDSETEPLNYEDTMLQLEKTSIETRIERLKGEKEFYDGLLKEGIQESIPKFGLK